MRFILGACLAIMCVTCNAYADDVSPQIQRLLAEKQEKIAALEKCDGKRKGFMIAGISTIGLTAVGVGVNFAQANKSNNLSGQIEAKNKELATQQANLKNINSQIEKLEKEKLRVNCEQDETKQWSNGQCIAKTFGIVQQAQPVTETPTPIVNTGVPVAASGPTEPKVDATKWTKEAYQQCLANVYTDFAMTLSSNPSEKVGIRWYWSKSHNGKWCEGYQGGKYFYDYKKNQNPCTKSKFTSLANGEWTVTLQNGKTMQGIAMCSNTRGTVKDELKDVIDVNGGGANCWCKLTKTDLSECLVTQKFSWIFMDNFTPIDASDMEGKGIYDSYHNPMPDEYYKLGQNTCLWQCANECGYQLFDYGGRDRTRTMHGVPWIDMYDTNKEALLNLMHSK